MWGWSDQCDEMSSAEEDRGAAKVSTEPAMSGSSASWARVRRRSAGRLVSPRERVCGRPGGVEVAVDGLAGDVEGFGDLGDGVAAFAVGAFLVMHLLSRGVVEVAASSRK